MDILNYHHRHRLLNQHDDHHASPCCSDGHYARSASSSDPIYCSRNLLMTSRPSVRMFVVVIVLLATGNSYVTSSSIDCGLYMAESSASTADATFWGLYAGHDIPAQTVVGYPELAIMAYDLKAHAYYHTEGDDEDETDGSGEKDAVGGKDATKRSQLNSIIAFLEDVIWVSQTAGAKFERGDITASTTGVGSSAIAAIPGAGAISSYNAKFTNALWNQTAPYYRPPWGEERGKNHPNRGALSPFYNIQMHSTMDIPSGSEVFLDYGTNWAKEEEEDEFEKEDYIRMDETVQQMIHFFTKHQESLDMDAKLRIYKFLLFDVMQAAVGPEKAKKIQSILPRNPDELHRVQEAGGTLRYSEPTVYRNRTWLEQNGRCMDHIRPGPSTVPDAGRGAFATRTLPTGTVIAPIPLIHIPDATIFTMHDLGQPEDGEQYVRVSDNMMGQQLIVNYVFSHPESSMVFLPVGHVVGFVNHHNEPNAKLVWSKHPKHHADWFQLEPAELTHEDYHFLGLVMELVATRDIQEGEEVFIDYGIEWKQAWDEHVKQWQNLLTSGEMQDMWPVHAVDMNYEHQTKAYKTVAELKSDPYPENVVLKAFLLVYETDNTGNEDDPMMWGGEGTNYNDRDPFRHDNLRDCEIIHRVQLDPAQYADVTPEIPYHYVVRWISNRGRPTYVKGIPHKAFVFVDRPYTSDQFVPHDYAFRHSIGIPDEIFPQGPWRNM